MMEISHVVDSKEPYFKDFCQSMYTWWTKENIEDWSLEKVTYYLKHCLSSTSIPRTYILHDGDIFIGSYQLLMEDLDSRPDLYPWLANFYVEKEYRGKGYGGKLLEHAQQVIKEMKIENLYLYTSHQGLYEKYGFTFLENVENFGTNKEERIYSFK